MRAAVDLLWGNLISFRTPASENRKAGLSPGLSDTFYLRTKFFPAAAQLTTVNTYRDYSIVDFLPVTSTGDISRGSVLTWISGFLNHKNQQFAGSHRPLDGTRGIICKGCRS